MTEAGRCRPLQRAGGDTPHVAAEDVLLRQVVLVAHLAEVEHRDDVGVNQRRAQLGLVDELRHHRRIARQLGAQPLDHEGAAEPLGAERHRGEHLRHPPFAEQIEQQVAAEGGWSSRSGGARPRRRGSRSRRRPARHAGPRPIEPGSCPFGSPRPWRVRNDRRARAVERAPPAIGLAVRRRRRSPCCPLACAADRRPTRRARARRPPTRWRRWWPRPSPRRRARRPRPRRTSRARARGRPG